MNGIINANEMNRVNRVQVSDGAEAPEKWKVTEMKDEDPKDQHVYMELPDGERYRVHMTTDVRSFVSRINNIYTSLLYLEEFIAMTTENMVNIADFLTGIKKVNEELLQYLDK